MILFNKFHVGELVHNRDTNQDGKVIGFRDTMGIPEYEVMVPVGNKWELGSSIYLWSENALRTVLLHKITSA